MDGAALTGGGTGAKPVVGVSLTTVPPNEATTVSIALLLGGTGGGVALAVGTGGVPTPRAGGRGLGDAWRAAFADPGAAECGEAFVGAGVAVAGRAGGGGVAVPRVWFLRGGGVGADSERGLSHGGEHRSVGARVSGGPAVCCCRGVLFDVGEHGDGHLPDCVVAGARGAGVFLSPGPRGFCKRGPFRRFGGGFGREASERAGRPGQIRLESAR